MSLPGGDRSTIESASTFIYDRPLVIKHSPAPEKVLNLDPKKIIPGKSRPDPQKKLFDKELVYSWSHKSMASGLVNLRNTCFLASVVQCLQHIPALNRYLLVHHKSICGDTNHKCIICMVKRLVEDCFVSADPVEPKELAYNLQEIAPHLIKGRQEDAHEFLHSLLNRMQDDLTYNIVPKPDQFEEMTTPIGHIFGGFLRSQIVCLGCNRASNSYEPLLSISLEIKSAGSLVQALDSFVSPEDMGGDEWYSCDNCKVKRRAIKSYSIDTPPRTLIVHLKRYNQEDRFQSKLSHHVEFDERLDLKPYISPEIACETRATYELCSVLVHLGNHVGAGHYYSYVADPNTFDQPQKRSWYVMNDDAVSPTYWGKVRDSEAYLLFYIRTDCKPKKIIEGSQRSILFTKFLPCTVRLRPLQGTAELKTLSNGPELILDCTKHRDGFCSVTEESCNRSPKVASALKETLNNNLGLELEQKELLRENGSEQNTQDPDQVFLAKRKASPMPDFPKGQKRPNCKVSPCQNSVPICNNELNKRTDEVVRSPSKKRICVAQDGDHARRQEDSACVPLRRFYSDLSHNRRADSHSRSRNRGRLSYSRDNRKRSRSKRSRSRGRHERSRSKGSQKFRSKFARSRSRSRERHRPRYREDSRGIRRFRTYDRRDRQRCRRSFSSSSSEGEKMHRSRERRRERRRSSRRHRDRRSRSRSRS